MMLINCNCYELMILKHGFITKRAANDALLDFAKRDRVGGSLFVINKQSRVFILRRGLFVIARAVDVMFVAAKASRVAVKPGAFGVDDDVEP